MKQMDHHGGKGRGDQLRPLSSYAQRHLQTCARSYARIITTSIVSMDNDIKLGWTRVLARQILVSSEIYVKCEVRF